MDLLDSVNKRRKEDGTGIALQITEAFITIFS
jgi:hypothetical protein